MNTSAREIANRANAAHSTGPKTPEGKARSAKNAITTALTGRTVLLPSDNLAAYEKHVRSYVKQFKPVTDFELGLLQAIADTAWRLHRIPHLILALETKGFEELAEQFEEMAPGSREVRIEMEAFLKYEKQFNNLQLQESRLSRRLEKDTAELRRLIRERESQQRQDMELASERYLTAEHDGVAFDPAEFGFEFSMAEIKRHVDGKRAIHIARHQLTAPNRDLARIQN